MPLTFPSYCMGHPIASPLHFALCILHFAFPCCVILSGGRSPKSKFCEARAKPRSVSDEGIYFITVIPPCVILSEQSESNPVGAPQAGSTSSLSPLSLSLYRSDRTAVALPMVGFRLRKRRTVAFSSLKMTRKIKSIVKSS